MAKQMSFSSIRLPSKSDIFISGHAIIFTINFINRFTICHHMKVTISFAIHPNVVSLQIHLSLRY